MVCVSCLLPAPAYLEVLPCSFACPLGFPAPKLPRNLGDGCSSRAILWTWVLGACSTEEMEEHLFNTFLAIFLALNRFLRQKLCGWIIISLGFGW